MKPYPGRAMNRLALAIVPLLILTACSSGQAFGPLEIDVPEEWRVTDRTDARLQIADGTAAEDTDSEPGDATVVFDVYLDSATTVQSWRDTHRNLDVEWTEEQLEIDGHDAVAFHATGEGVAGARETVLIPDHRVLVIYRAAFENDRPAFDAGYEPFREALRSIRFSEDPVASPA